MSSPASYTSTVEEFYEKAYHEEVESFLESGDDALWIEFAAINDYDGDIARDYLQNPTQTKRYFDRALVEYVDGLDGHDSIEGAETRVTDEGGELDHLDVPDLDYTHIGNYVPVHGQLAKVTEKKPLLVEGAFECYDCGTLNRVNQPRHSVREPNSCSGCDDGSSFRLNAAASEFTDQRKLKLETPPDIAAQGEGASATVYVTGDLCDYGGENGIPDRAGQKATILAERKLREDGLYGRNASPVCDTWLDAGGIVFHGTDNEEVEIDRWRDEIEEAMSKDDPIKFFAENIAPALEADENLWKVMLGVTAFAFGAYRCDIDGATYRGSLHMGVIGDPGTGKSTLLSELAKVLPICEFRSGTGLSEVGLTAATIQEEFAGESKWTLKPGILPRANGGHCIIDEVDEVLDGNSKSIHDALEGEQMVKIDKAGISANLETRTALLASGNPIKGRFDRYEDVVEQIDLDAALIDRMDILLDLLDVVDEEKDREKASHYLESYDEASMMHLYQEGHLEVKPEMNESNRAIPADAMRAWVAYARQNIFPTLTEDAKEELQEFYLNARNANDAYESGDDKAIPVTMRTLGAGIRLSTAYARGCGSETVEKEHVERAKEVTKANMGLTFDPVSGQFDASKTDSSQMESAKDVVDVVASLYDDNEEYDVGVPQGVAVSEVRDRFNISESKASSRINRLCRQGELLRPQHDLLKPI